MKAEINEWIFTVFVENIAVFDETVAIIVEILYAVIAKENRIKTAGGFIYEN